jgi:hypothetical protein
MDILGDDHSVIEHLRPKDRFTLVRRVGMTNPNVAVFEGPRMSACNMVLFNKMSTEGDFIAMENICTRNHLFNLDDVFQSLHALGLVALDRSRTRGYSPSRILKLKLFGKYSEIHRFLKHVDMLLRAEDDTWIVVSEESVSAQENALLFDFVKDMNFDIVAIDSVLEQSDPMIDEDEEATTTGTAGIRRHLELSIGGSIERVDVSLSARHANPLLAQLLPKFSTSHIWKPSAIETERFEIPKTTYLRFDPSVVDLHDCSEVRRLLTADDGCIVSNESITNIMESLHLVVVEEGRMYKLPSRRVAYVTDRNANIEMSDFMHILAAIDHRWFYWYILTDTSVIEKMRTKLGLEPFTNHGVRLASFMSVDGIINEQLVADIFYTIYSVPGLNCRDIKERMAVLPICEVRLILATLEKAKLVEQQDGDWYALPPPEW